MKTNTLITRLRTFCYGTDTQYCPDRFFQSRANAVMAADKNSKGTIDITAWRSVFGTLQVDDAAKAFSYEITDLYTED